MPAAKATEKKILEALKRVPPERWPEVLRYLKALRRTRATDSALAPIRTGDDLIASGLVGMWANRTDIKNNHEFARKLRKRPQRRQANRHASGR